MALSRNENLNEMGWLRRIAIAVELLTATTALDNNGDAVPVYGPHTFTYDPSGKLATDTVMDGNSRWVRTYTRDNAQLVADSGWVKQ